MENLKLAELAGGALQEKFETSLQKVLENMLDLRTPYRDKRSITIKLSFTQNEMRDDIKAHIDVSEKLAPMGATETSFTFGRDLHTGKIMIEEYGKQIKGQMSLSDLAQPQLEETGDGRQVDTETGEIVENTGKVIDMRKVM